MTPEALDKVINGTPEERKYLCSLSFGLFSLYYFQHYFKYSLADYQKDFINDFEEITECKIRELILITFREGAKTSTAKLYLIWLICYKKRVYINIDSFDKENAERILFDIAYELTNNTRLRADFGVLFSKSRGIEDVKQNRINNFITENGIRVEAHSTGESVRGRLHLNQRPDFLLLDDFENNRTKESAAHTKQIRDHITEAMGGLAENGVIVYLANYLSEHGNVQFLIDRSKKDPMIRLRNIPIVIDGKPAWPSKYCMTDEEAKTTGKKSIESMIRQFGSYVFSYEFMNTPIDDSMSEFKKDFIQHVQMEEVRQKETVCYVTIDPAISEKSSADFTGITINFVDTHNKWYLKTYRMKFNSKELIDHLFYIHKTYRPTFIGMEEVAFTMAIQPFLEDEMRKQQMFFTITPLKHKGIAKAERIRGLIPRWESRSVFLIGDNSELLDEMRAFPHGQKDDVLDSLSYQIHNARPPFRPNYPLMEGFPGKEDLNPAI
jgi:phage terminase large subunit-like protein